MQTESAGRDVPSVGVVVSTYDRAELLPSLVEGLSAQTLDGYEVVIVDNGSRDQTPEVLARLAADDPRIRLLRKEDNAGPAAARNLGWQSTDAPLIAFIDDDCVPDPGWLSALVAAAERADIVQGRTIPLAGEEDQPLWFDRSQKIEAWSGRYETCNLLVRREVLARLGGFDVSFPVAMGEDTDLGLRAVRAGATTAFAETALVRHLVWRGGFRGFLRHRRRHAEVVPLYRINPEARELLVWGFVVRWTHLLVWGLVPLTAISVWMGMPWLSPLVVAAWCTWNTVRTHRMPHRPLRRFVSSAMLLLGYAYETWCFAVASVRHRTLVL